MEAVPLEAVPVAAAPLVVLMVVVVEDSRAFGWQQDVTAYCEGGMP